MKLGPQVLHTIIMSIIGIAILTGHADIRWIAWYWVSSGVVLLLGLLIIGLKSMGDA